KGTFADTSGNLLIPDLKTDMIFSALAQELGLIGISAFLLVYMVFALRGFRIAMAAEDGFSKLLALGLTFGFAFQTFIIVGGVVRGANGEVLAFNRVLKRNGNTYYLRRYPTGKLASDVVGYSTIGRSRAGIERSLNDYLTSSNSDLHTVLDRIANSLEGKTVK